IITEIPITDLVHEFVMRFKGGG
ncbi:MAG: hypothetical protein K0Q73_2665, partial [Paenibacillus sp.]|nr:hypothetical protein [Paenibacillus sp.]